MRPNEPHRNARIARRHVLVLTGGLVLPSALAGCLDSDEVEPPADEEDPFGDPDDEADDPFGDADDDLEDDAEDDEIDDEEDDEIDDGEEDDDVGDDDVDDDNGDDDIDDAIDDENDIEEDGPTDGEYVDEEPDYGDWFADVPNYEGTLDLRGETEVTVEVGAGAEGFEFEPPAVMVDEGSTVVWEWTGEGDDHNVVEEGGKFESDLIGEEGSTFEYEFTAAGIYLYMCEPHDAQGMRGAVVVGEPDEDESDDDGGLL